MNTAVVVASPNVVSHAMTAPELRAQVQLIQQVMKAVMKDKTHYGVVPGTPKPSLWKPGAEVLCATFHIAPTYRVDDLSDDDCIRYRVTCVGTHQGTGVVLGEGMGECSSNEEKYRWRNAVCDEEWEDTAEDRRRMKWQKGYGDNARPYQRAQVRTEPADIANTVLKMACKRAQIAMTLNVTAASDIFTQDLEDMPEELRGAGDDGGTGQQPRQQSRQQQPRGRQQTQAPRSRASNGNGNGQGGGNGRCTASQVNLINVKLDQSGIPDNEFCKRFNINEIAELPFAQVNEALQWIQNPEGREPGADDEG